MAKFCYLLLLFCATAQAANVLSRLAQDYSDELSDEDDTVGPSCQEPSQNNENFGLPCKVFRPDDSAPITESLIPDDNAPVTEAFIPDDTAPVTEALVPDDTTPVTVALIPDAVSDALSPDDTTPVTDAPSSAGILGRLGPDLMGRFGVTSPLPAAFDLTYPYPDRKVNWTPEQRESFEQEKLLNKFIGYNDDEMMDSTLPRILVKKGIYDKCNVHSAIEAARRMDQDGAKTDELLAEALEKRRLFDSPDRLIKIKQAVEEARNMINKRVAPEVKYYYDDESMDSEIGALIDNLTLEEKATFAEELAEIFRTAHVPLDHNFFHTLADKLSSHKFVHALRMQTIVADARREVKLAKKELGKSQLAKYNGDKWMTEALETMLEGEIDVQQVVAEARWTVKIRNAIRHQMKFMVHKLLSVSEKYQENGHKRRLLASVVHEDDTDILEKLLKITGSTADFEFALATACHLGTRAKPLGVEALKFLLGDERATSAKACTYLRRE